MVDEEMRESRKKGIGEEEKKDPLRRCATPPPEARGRRKMKSKKKREEGRERGRELGALTPALSHQTPLPPCMGEGGREEYEKKDPLGPLRGHLPRKPGGGGKN